MSRLSNVQSFTFYDRIPGWTAPKIHILSDIEMRTNEKKSQALVLNFQHNSIKQKISFGTVRKYSFINTFSEELKKKARDIMA